MLVQKWWIIIVLLCGTACVQPRLIEDASLDQGQLHEVISRAISASDLPVLAPLTVELANRSKLHNLLELETNKETPNDDRITAESVMGEPLIWKDIHLNLLSRVTTGLYLPRTKALYLISEPVRGIHGSIHINSFGQLGEEVTLAHEVIHALQHQHYPDLFDSNSFPKNHSDARTALQATLEGSATFAAAKTLGYMGKPRDPDKVISDSLSVGPLADEDPRIRKRMTFPYTYGYRMAYYAGMALLASPPASTEQVIHDRDRSFLAINFSTLQILAKKSGCRTLAQDTMGELGVSLWLEKNSKDTEPGISEGWDGDRWIVLKCNRENVFAWLTSWDTPKDAIEFEDAIKMVAETIQDLDQWHHPIIRSRNDREVLVLSNRFPIKSTQIFELANRARVTTREELAAHFPNEE